MIFWQSGAEKEAQRMARQQALGLGPSAARAQLAQGMSQAQQQMQSQASGVRQNPLAAMRMAQQQGGQMMAQQQMQMAQLRAQEQIAGQQLYSGAAQRNTEAQNGLLGGLLSAGSTTLAAGVSSDIRGKEAIQDGGQRTDELLRAMKPQQFKYTDPAQNGTGPRLGVMAQDVQQAAPELVDEGPDGRLRLDGPGALSASLAANARLAQRLDDLERRLGGGAGAPAAAPSTPRRRRAPVAETGPSSEDRARMAAAPTPEDMARVAAYDAVDDGRQPSVNVPREMVEARRQQAEWEAAHPDNAPLVAAPQPMPPLAAEAMAAAFKRARHNAQPGRNLNAIIGQHQGKFTRPESRGSWMTNSEIPRGSIW